MTEVGHNTVIGKVVEIFDCFSLLDGTRSLADLARCSGLAKPTVLRLVRMLCDADLLERVPDGYRLGSKLYYLGMLVPRERILREVASPYMEEIYQRARQTVHLGLPYGDEVLYIQKLGSHNLMTSPSRLGGRMPLYCTAIGKAILAYSDEEVVERVIEGGLSPLTPRTLRTRAALLRELAEIRERGVAFEFEESCIGVACLGAPILDAAGVPIAGLSVSGPVHNFSPRPLAPHVRKVADNISRAFELQSTVGASRVRSRRIPQAQWGFTQI